MRERAQQIGAEVELVSAPGEGTAVKLKLPQHPVTGPNVATEGLKV
jgi:two-component system nitrate/nitrite sensor histidine kinase NarX